MEEFPPDIEDKFNSYFTFTSSLTRSIPLGGDNYRYPKDSIISDVTFLASLLAELHQFYLDKKKLKDFIEYHKKEVRALFLPIEAFWNQNNATMESMSVIEPIDINSAEFVPLAEIFFSIYRNGFQHFRYRYENLTSHEYFQSCTFPHQDILPRLLNLPLIQKDEFGYNCFIMDWDRNRQNLRVIQLKYWRLRYHLHLFFSALFEKRKDANVTHPKDIFGVRRYKIF